MQLLFRLSGEYLDVIAEKPTRRDSVIVIGRVARQTNGSNHGELKAGPLPYPARVCACHYADRFALYRKQPWARPGNPSISQRSLQIGWMRGSSPRMTSRKVRSASTSSSRRSSSSTLEHERGVGGICGGMLACAIGEVGRAGERAVALPPTACRRHPRPSPLQSLARLLEREDERLAARPSCREGSCRRSACRRSARAHADPLHRGRVPSTDSAARSSRWIIWVPRWRRRRRRVEAGAGAWCGGCVCRRGPGRRRGGSRGRSVPVQAQSLSRAIPNAAAMIGFIRSHSTHMPDVTTIARGRQKGVLAQDFMQQSGMPPQPAIQGAISRSAASRTG